MSPNPYLIQGPAVISFSGGRTSGYLLKHIIDAHGGTLPADVVVLFANTGKEMPETLDFVRDCEVQWNVPIVWLEYDPEAPNQTRVVDHFSASREGEPFEAVIKSHGILPNPVTRFCTIEMKIRRFGNYARHVLGWEHWTSVIGLRSDEPRRLAKLGPRNAAKKDRWQTIAPLDAARVVKADIHAWWASQNFQLELEVDANGDTAWGNCDMCFLKGRKKVERLMSAKPERADWWVEQERAAPELGRARNPSVAMFRMDRPRYEMIRRHALWIKDLRAQAGAPEPEIADDEQDCACTD